jgi:anti-sigma factor RsiW
MRDSAHGLSERELAELSALADGTLPAERAAAVEARVAASPELRELVERQRRALAATQMLSEEPVPSSLAEGVEELRSRGARRHPGALRLWPRLALVAGLAAVIAVIAAVVLSRGPGSPTVADAAALASEPPSGAPPPPLAGSSAKLTANVEGVAFPNLARWAGWKTLGVRHGQVDGRDATVVFYGKGSRRLAYVIVAGAGLPRPSGAASAYRNGVRYQTLRSGGRLAVTWRRGGHTCVLIGDATVPQLVHLASWELTG